jgi:hypothetical protein
VLTLADDLQSGYSAAVQQVNAALGALVDQPGDGQSAAELRLAYMAAMDWYGEESQLLEIALNNVVVDAAANEVNDLASEVEDARAATALIDGALGARSFLVAAFYDGEGNERRDGGITEKDIGQTFGEQVEVVDRIRLDGVTDELIGAALSGHWIGVPEVASVDDAGTEACVVDNIAAPFDSVVERAADLLIEMVRNVVLDQAVDNLAAAAGWLGDGLNVAFRAVRGSTLHIFVEGGLWCFRRLLRKLGAVGRPCFEVVRHAFEAIQNIGEAIQNMSEDVVRFVCGVNDKIQVAQLRFQPGNGRPEPHMERMWEVANNKDKRKWQVAAWVGAHAIPVAKSTIVVPGGGLPILVILIAADAGIDFMLLNRAVTALQEAA